MDLRSGSHKFKHDNLVKSGHPKNPHKVIVALLFQHENAVIDSLLNTPVNNTVVPWPL
jgi:hypothetical protein